MIPGIIFIIVGILFLWIGSVYGKKRDTVAREGIPAVGKVTGIETLEGGDIQFEIRFTDHNGIVRTGRSQQFDRTYGRYGLGDSISIRYLIVKTMGIEAVRVHVEDQQMKQGGTMAKLMLKIIGVVLIVFGVILFVL